MKCGICGSEFPDPVWPNTRAKFCSRKCTLASYYQNNKLELAAKQSKYHQDNPDKTLATKRRYNTSSKGREAQERYRDTHDTTGTYLAKYRSDPIVRAIQRSRELSRKILLATRPRVCEECGLVGITGRQVHCHHRDGNPINRAVSNLMWLCVPCHAQVHSETTL